MTAVWATLLGNFTVSEGEVLLYLDPHALDSPQGSHGALVRIEDRWSLRRFTEQHLRNRRSSSEPLLVHATVPGLEAERDLPADVQAFPVVSLNVRLPSNMLPEVRLLPSSAVAALATPGSLAMRTAAFARELTGLAWPPPADGSLLPCIRLATKLGPALRNMLADSCPPGIGRSILEAADPLIPLTQLWEAWVEAGRGHPTDRELRAAADDLAGLAASGMLPVPTGFATDLPSVITQLRPARTRLDEAENLLAVLPESSPDLEGWFAVAEAWARVRWALAAAHPAPAATDLENEAWTRWGELDEAWQTWLKGKYGALLSRNVLNPSSVHMVAPYLAANSVTQGAKVLLLVLDGLGLAQWQHIREALDLEVAVERHLMACLPSITTVSRQAIFAGKLPNAFASKIDTTSGEEEHWQRFWTKEGLAPDSIHYQKLTGRDSSEWIDPPPAAVVSGIVVNAVDDLMHGVSVNGDRQFRAGLAMWIKSGFITSALAWARRNMVEVWVTSDHGNLSCVGLNQTITQEGVLVTSRGRRVRTYRTAQLRDRASLPGTAWNPPGYPEASGALLFAPGRGSYHRDGVIVGHGGLSLDEVVVPFARLIP